MPEIRFPIAENLSRIVMDKLSVQISLHAKGGASAKAMYSEQFAYGHREILLKYSGLSYSAQLLGNLQHGVYGPKDVIDFKVPKFLGGRASKFWVWSKDTESQARRCGFKNVYAIGSPWLYLRAATGSRNRSGFIDKKKVLIMGGHSQTNAWDATSKSQKRELARQYREIVGPSEATVCLHAVDFCDLDTRNAYLEYNFFVTCLGSAQSTVPWTQASNRTRMLLELIRLMESHSHFLTDDFSTQLFYAISMGMEIAIYPELLFHKKYHSPKAQNPNKPINHLDYLSRHMPGSLNQFGDASALEDIAKEVLGVDSLMAPSELREVLDYRLNVYPDSSIEPW